MNEENLIYDAPKNTKNTVIRLAKLLKPQSIRLCIIGAFVILYTVLNIYAPFRSAQVVDSIWKSIQVAHEQGVEFKISWDGVGKDLFSLSMLYLFTWIFYYLQSYLVASVADNLTLTLRKKIAAKLNKLPLRFFDQNKAGEILSRVTNDLDKITETLQTGFLKLIVSIGTIIGSLAVMIYYNITLTLIFIVFMIICMIITRVVSNKNLKYAALRQESLATLTGTVEEYYTGRNVIKAYNHELESIEEVHKNTELNRKATQKADFITNSINPLIRLITRISQAAIAVIAGNAMIKGTMSIGVVQAFFQYVNQAAEPLTEASYMINTLQSALASAERTFELLDDEEEVSDTKKPINLKRAKGEISFEHISFGYTPDNILMKDINFNVKPGQKIAVVGSTGAGKTTLINLLMRFYEVNGGKILIDGVSTVDMERKGLRQNFGMVLQDTWIFGGTVAENIAYGKPKATREEIIEAAKAARIDYFIRTMPQGYDTMLDNEGGSLSVGQRQLLTIARVFLCNPPILILDEATSSVDTRTEKEIGKAMQELMSGRTSFVIAHRLSTIRDADIILFMENGTIIEQGNHKELLEKKGAYATLYYSQFE